MKFMIIALLSFSSAAFAGAEYEISNKESESTVVCSISASDTIVSVGILDKRNNRLGDFNALSTAVSSQLPSFDCAVDNDLVDIQSSTKCKKTVTSMAERAASICAAVKACENRVNDMMNQPGVSNFTSDLNGGYANWTSKYGVANDLAQVRGANGCNFAN